MIETLIHRVKTKGTLYFTDENGVEQECFAQAHELVKVILDDEGNELEFIDYVDEFYLSDYEDGEIIETDGFEDYDWNGYSEDWSNISEGECEAEKLAIWNEYKSNF